MKVPDGLSQYVVSSKKAQANWYLACPYLSIGYLAQICLELLGLGINLLLMVVHDYVKGITNFCRLGKKPSLLQGPQRRLLGLLSRL